MALLVYIPAWVAEISEYLKDVIPFLEIFGLIIELVVLAAIFREMRALRRHGSALEKHEKQVIDEIQELGKVQRALKSHEEQILTEIRELQNIQTALKKHEEQLDAVRPIYSTFYTTPEEIMELSISFTEEAKEIYALGTIGSLLDTEIRPNEKQADFEQRKRNASPEAKRFVAATESSILTGCEYHRVMDFRPIDASEDARLEILANVNFFRRILNASGTHDLHLELYHSPDIVRGRGDYHFRCNDQRVDLRIGGHGTKADAAISITDARVVQQYKQYYLSLLEFESTRLITLDDLIILNDLLVVGNLKGVEDHLSEKPMK